MTKVELVSKVSENSGVPVTHAKKVVDSVFDEIISSVASGDVVNVQGFGKFENKPVSAKVGINPKTKEKVDIPASCRPSFKAGRVFKDTLKEAYAEK